MCLLNVEWRGYHSLHDKSTFMILHKVKSKIYNEKAVGKNALEMSKVLAESDVWRCASNRHDTHICNLRYADKIKKNRRSLTKSAVSNGCGDMN